ncbi:MAG: diacylglycerol kinase [Treponema sp.]|nr:diacylglycerol kinase [Treponema sp.]
MRMEIFAESLADICMHSAAAPGRSLRWVVIANPTAGGFVLPSRWKKCLAALEKSRAAARTNPLREDCSPAGISAKFSHQTDLASNGLIPTDGAGSAAKITRALLEEAETAPDGGGVPFYLIIAAGGDGTSLEALSVLYHASLELRSNIAVVRLPMGTGNDGADSPELAAALELLIRPSRVEFTPALRLLTAQGGPANALAESKGPFLAFNILSTGLDAFVTHMTNKMKGKLPGDFYKLWVDIASLLYDSLYTVGVLDVRALDWNGGEVVSLKEKLLLLAVGISGHRTYGSQKKILPDDRNVCAVRQMPLLRKLALKGLFTTGAHIDKPESILFSANRVEFSGSYPILAQMDGETVLLQPEDFPAAIELTGPVIPVLRILQR